MISALFERLRGAPEDGATDSDARLALTALLVRLARSDNDYATAEQLRIDEITQARFGLSLHDAQELRFEAETAEAEAPDTVRFTRAIKDAVAYEARIGVIEAMWSVALADAERDEHEDALMRMVSNLLGVNDRDSALARQRAKAR